MIDHLYWYIDERSKIPVLDFVKVLTKQERAKIRAYFQELKLHGHNLRRPMADYLGHGVYELRPKNNRVFYFFYLRNNIVFVHAIRKDSDKIHENDLQTCLKRKFIVEELGKNIIEFKGDDL
jgi:phage-related protein